MPALSFKEEWLDKLLRGDKQQTTRPQTTRIWIGDPIVHIYNQQRRRIIDKPLRRTTADGRELILHKIESEKTYPSLGCIDTYFAHFLGKVKITEVYDIHPCEMSESDLETWAKKDGFECFDPEILTIESINKSANWWFSERYGNEWVQRWWTVVRWDGWLERYFLADESDAL